MNVIVANQRENELKTLNIDVIKSIVGEYDVNQLASMFQNFFYQRMILDITAIANYRDIKNLQTLSTSLDMDKVILLLNDSPEISNQNYLSNLVSIGIYNYAKNIEEVQYLLEHPNTYRDMTGPKTVGPSFNQMVYGPAQTTVVNNLFESNISENKSFMPNKKIIGIQNLTENSGATTLVYMLKKELQRKSSVLAIELDKRDFMFFKEKDMISISTPELKRTIEQNKNKDVFLIDLNGATKIPDVLTDVLYLIEPSMLKLHKMMFVNKDILKNLQGKKIILNQSLLSEKDIKRFESEINAKIFFNIPPLNERENKFPLLEQLISRLGL